MKKNLIFLFCAFFAATAFTAPSVVLADNQEEEEGEDDDDPPFECDARFDDCGTPELSGGNGGGGGSILIANTDLGDAYQSQDDYSGDGVGDSFDNCPFEYNPDQTDTSGDGVGDACDNCPDHNNPDQTDTNGNGIGDACDPDISGDGIPNEEDNCPYVFNPEQEDTSGDGVGDACSDDINGNGIPNEEDPCPFVVWDPDTEDAPDSDSCFRDSSGDGVYDHLDNCPNHYNPDQEDMAGDGIGDACSSDISGDGIPNEFDNCPYEYNPDQTDSDRDGVGDACDDTFCFVVDGDHDNCLDPEQPLYAYSPPMLGETVTPVRLRLFANQRNLALRYQWSLTSAPDGSDARIVDPNGTTTISTPFEYRYVGDDVPHLMADLPGEYEVRLEVETIWEDRVTGELNQTATATSTITVDGEAGELPEEPSSCSSTGGAGGTTLALVFALFGLFAIRRPRTEPAEA